MNISEQYIPFNMHIDFQFSYINVKEYRSLKHTKEAKMLVLLLTLKLHNFCFLNKVPNFQPNIMPLFHQASFWNGSRRLLILY